MLPNTCELEVYNSDGATGVVYDSAVTLTSVAIQNKRVRSLTASGEILIGSAVLFIDKRNSKADGGTVTKDLFKVNSRIIFNGRKYFIIDVEPLDYDTGKGIHHWEVSLK